MSQFTTISFVFSGDRFGDSLGSPFPTGRISVGWYSCTFLFVVIGVWVGIKRRTASALLSGLFVCYFILYASHLEGYYQLHGGSVLPYQTLRFSMNLMTLWSILGGVGLAELLKLRGIVRNHRVLVAALALTYVVACYVCTAILRGDAHSDEAAVRIKPALRAAEVAAQFRERPTFVVTLEPLVVQMFASEATRVIGLYALDGRVLQKLLSEHQTFNVLYLRQSQYGDSVSEERYGAALACLQSFPQRAISRGGEYSLILITLSTKEATSSCVRQAPEPVTH